MNSSSNKNFRPGYPGYTGYIPYKYSIIGKTIGGTTEMIEEMLTDNVQKEINLGNNPQEDYGRNTKNYFNREFNRSYPLEEDKIYTTKSKDAKTWIRGDKYKIYPQQIPGTQTYIPGIIPSNIYGMNYAKASAISIKGDYDKTFEGQNSDRYKSIFKENFKNPMVNLRGKSTELRRPMTKSVTVDDRNEVYDKLMKIYHSKIAKVPTPGYSGHNSIFQKRIGYLNYDKIMEAEALRKNGMTITSESTNLPPKFREALSENKNVSEELPFVVGYKGFRSGIYSRNYFGHNFHDTSIDARNDAKLLKNIRIKG